MAFRIERSCLDAVDEALLLVLNERDTPCIASGYLCKLLEDHGFIWLTNTILYFP